MDSIKNEKNEQIYSCELCHYNTSHTNILIYSWQTITPPGYKWIV